jgi:stage V sporulation protein D (sporulation-specific penicillin-binding protein)
MTHIMHYLSVPTLEDEATHAKPKAKDIETYKPAIPSEDVKEFRLPSFTGWTIRDTGEWLTRAGLGFQPEGSGYAYKQDPGIGATVKRGSSVHVYFRQ